MGDVDGDSYEFLKVQAKSDQIQVRCFSVEVDEKVDIGAFAVVSPRHRAEDAWIGAVMASHEFAHPSSEKFNRTHGTALRRPVLGFQLRRNIHARQRTKRLCGSTSGIQHDYSDAI